MTQAVKDSKVKSEAPAPAAVDWGKVQVTESDKAITRTGKSSVDLSKTPFPNLYARSRATGKTQDVGPLPSKEACAQAVRLINATAKAANGGVKIRTDMDRLVVHFQASERKQFTPGKPRRPRQNQGVTDEAYNELLVKFSAEASAWNAAHPDDLVASKPAKSGK